jgi:hypothetical protein
MPLHTIALNIHNSCLQNNIRPLDWVYLYTHQHKPLVVRHDGLRQFDTDTIRSKSPEATTNVSLLPKTQWTELVEPGKLALG